MAKIFKTFVTDRIVRHGNGAPAGRAILVGDYEFEFEKDIALAMLEVFGGLPNTVKGQIFYVDGIQYRVPIDLPDIKINMSQGKLLINNFYLEKV